MPRGATSLHASPGGPDDRLVGAIVAVLDLAKVSGAEALIALRQAGETVRVDEDDAKSAYERVRLRSIGVEDELLNAEGGGLSDAEFAAALGVGSRETVRSYREKGKIFAWSKDSRNLRYPAWQVHKRALLPGLPDVLAEFSRKGRKSGFAIANYFLTESDELGGRRPLDLLRENRVDDVKAHARRYGDIGA